MFIIVEIRHSIDKVFFSFFNKDQFNYNISKEFIIQSSQIKSVNEISKGALKYNKFSDKSGWCRTNFLSQNKKKFVMCYYKPLIKFNNKIISWIVFDVEKCNGLAYVNINELYMHLNNIKAPKIKLSDTNYLPEDLTYDEPEIIRTLMNFIIFIKKKFLELVKKFQKLSFIEYDFNISVLEWCEEYLNCNVFSLNINAVRQQIRKNFNTNNCTIYLNPERLSWKHQVKIYEKTPTLTRLEYTFFNFKECESLEDYVFAINFMVKDAINVYNLSGLLDNPIYKYDIYESYNLWFQALKGTSKSFQKAEFDYLLSKNSYVFNRSTQSFKLRLIRMKLIEIGDKRGLYYPTAKLIQCKNALSKYTQQISLFNEFEIQIKEREEQIIRGQEENE